MEPFQKFFNDSDRAREGHLEGRVGLAFTGKEQV
jgi:hypothetical protein